MNGMKSIIDPIESRQMDASNNIVRYTRLHCTMYVDTLTHSLTCTTGTGDQMLHTEAYRQKLYLIIESEEKETRKMRAKKKLGSCTKPSADGKFSEIKCRKLPRSIGVFVAFASNSPLAHPRAQKPIV